MNNLALQLKEKQTEVQVGRVPRATDGKRDATTDVLRKPGGSAPAILAPEQAKAAASTLSPGSSECPASSPSPAASPDKRRKGRQSLKALDELLENRVATAAGMFSKWANTLEPSQASVAPKRHRFPYETKMLLAVPIIVIILGFTFLLLYQRPKARRVQFCVTKGCQEHRDRIEAQIDKDVEPCEDFRAYVCGHWTGSGKAYQSRSQMNDMRLHWLHMFPETLRKGLVHFPAGRKVDAMFKSCMAQKGPKIAIIKKFMNARGILWPEKSPEDIPPAMALFDLSFNWNADLWFALRVLPAVPGKVQRRIFFGTNDEIVLWKTLMQTIPKKHLESVYTGLFRIFANDSRSTPDNDEMSRTIDILEYVFNTLAPTGPSRTRTGALFRLGDIDNVTSLPIAGHMKDMLNAALRITPPVTLDELVLVSDLSVFNGIMTILSRVNDTALLRHVSYLFVETYAAVAYPRSFLLIMYGSEEHAKEARPRFCAHRVEPSFKLLLAALASVAHFSTEERQGIIEHLEHLGQVAANKTGATSWLDSRIKKRAVEKLSSVHTVVWPSEAFLSQSRLDEVYKDFPDDAPSFTEFWIETHRRQRLLFGTDAASEELLLGDNYDLPYVRYIEVLNHLSVCIGALAPPLYYRDGTMAMLHGGLLYLYSRALISAIESEGVEIDSQGETMTSQPSDKAPGTFEERVLGCLPGNASIFPEIPAIEVAYEAFKLHQGDNDTQLSEELTEEKVFFITACLSSCAKTPADNLYGGDCNKAMMNFAPFAQAFSCPVGSKMNPAEKCSFYD
ncbi:hypothetical protein HPB51_000374 [Rhipicephalus microplus]|uniref:M13 family peptidase n=1 Tax=Rhipicephalus microplus TaxID=6941 RepID=A0A9J6DXR4_RHIMP|nr:hypothetical protein HPB51_000374 [Rhipicephalus microplus]